MENFKPWSREKQKEYFEKSLKGFNSEIKRKNIERISENIIDQAYQKPTPFYDDFSLGQEEDE